jgi:uncharacterized membrane protein YbhN (UPF0104 family)
MSAAAPRRRWLGGALQLLGSGVVLWLLLRNTELGELGEALRTMDPRWLLLLLPAKIMAGPFHELRLYLALRPWAKLPLWRVLGIGFTSGLVNTIIPMRSGDVLAVTLLRLECRVATTAAITAVTATSVIEAVVFGVALLGLLLVQGPAWAAGVAELDLDSALRDMGLLTAAAVMGTAVLAVGLRRLHRRFQKVEGAPKAGLVARLAEAGQGLSPRALAVNTGLAAVQVAALFAALLLLFRTLGMEPVPALLAAGLVQAGGSLAATVLPQTLGAGQAAAAVLVLAAFGVPSHEALAFAALNWATHQALALALGAVPTWRRLGRLGTLVGRGARGGEG